MISEDFAKIFYSNFTPSIDWANIDEIAWMYKESLFTVYSKVIASGDEFADRIDFVLNPKNGFMKNGESGIHQALKSFATDYLIKHCKIPEKAVRYEYPLAGFEVDVVDKDLYFPVECGDTNALKLEKYLALPPTKKMLIVPYPQLGDVKVFIFKANPRFFEYIKHKQSLRTNALKETFLKQKRLKYR